MAANETDLEHALGALLSAVLEHPAGAQEWAAARREFGALSASAGAGAPARLPGPDAAGDSGTSDPTVEAALAQALRRAEEWFVLERHSPGLGGVPIELSLHGGLDLDDDPEEDALAALLASTASVFEVTGVNAGEGVWVRDLLAFGEHPLIEPEGSRSLAVGDLLVGRLFPVGDELYRISRAAGVFRSPALKEALGRDLEQARSGRRGVVRLASPELERMFFGPSPEQERRRVAAIARGVLVRGGLSGAEVEAIFARLASTPFDGRMLPGGSDAVGDIMAELAFDTEVDLEPTRAALLELWPLMSPRPAAAEAPGAAPLQAEGERRRTAADAMAAFDRGRAEGRDLEELFRQLERDLELEEGSQSTDATHPEDDPEAGAPDFPGVVGAMVEEYLWELERERGAHAAELQAILRKLSVFAEPIGLFEELGGRELLSFTAVWLPQWGELETPAEARSILDALDGFCSWVDERHELPLRKAYDEHTAGIRASLPRVTAANRARTERAEATAGDWFAVQEVRGARVDVTDGRGRVVTCAVPMPITAHLEPGDLIRGRTAGESLEVFCVYPPEARELATPAG